MTQPDLVHVVDDDLSVREALSSLLRSVGLAVRTYPSAADFLAAERAGGFVEGAGHGSTFRDRHGNW